ncbi:MAG: LptF/LptG family permease [Puniceicoccales bacterium]|jgi:lipopolysaccharide export LptBFGC system permease protein LptF|nr:LptF/LptG family permease [Puniceicoccales bacterium]
MRLLHRYVLRQWLATFLCTHAVLTCLLLLEDVYKNLEYFLKAKVTLAALATYHAFLAASFFPLITPVAIFVSVLLSLGQLYGRNEITAMKSVGIHILEVCKPLAVSTAVLAAINLIFEAAVMPAATDYVAAFRTRTDAKIGYATVAKKIGFYNHRDNRIWCMKSLDKLSYEAKDVLISCYNESGQEELRIHAQAAKFLPVENFWHFQNCSLTAFDTGTGSPKSVDLFTEKDFENFREHPKMIISSLKKTRDLSFHDVKTLLEYAGTDSVANAFRVRFHGTFANAANCIIVMFLAIPFAVTGAKIKPLIRTAKACVFLLLFLVLDTLFALLGNGGVLSPAVAAWAANAVILLPIAGLLRTAM